MNALLLLIYFSFQTSWNEIDKTSFQNDMKKAEKHFQLDTYAFTYEYASFIGRETSAAHDRMQGNYKRKGKQVYISFEDQLTLQNEKYKVLIDKATKEIIVMNAQPLEPSELDKVIHENTLDLAVKISKRNVASNTQYRLEYPKGAEYADNVLEFDNAYMLKRIITHYGYKKELEQNGGKKIVDFPRVELLISNYSKKVEIGSNETVESILEIKNREIHLKALYKNYRITDLRN